jgi:hypothetical protein
MHVFIFYVLTAVVGIGLGYGFRGLIHKDISKVDLTAFATRLESLATADAATVKNEVLSVAADIRKKV